MTKRIFGSICTAAFCVFLASAVLFMGVLYHYFSRVQGRQLRMQTELAAQGVTNEGIGYFEGLGVTDYRITWIGVEGIVLYDSRSDSSEMENHLEREEIKRAFSEGIGESSRYSITLLERLMYCAKRLPDGTVLRLSIAQNTLLTLFLGMLKPGCVIFAVALMLSLALAFRLSKAIVEPLNRLNLDDPLDNDGYEELMPLLKRIAAQQLRIRRQKEELQKKQSEFEAVTTGMAEGIVLFNENQIILSINPAAARLFGADQSCGGRHLLSLSRDLKLQELLLKAGEGKHGEMLMELGGGTYQLDASPVFSDGLILGAVLLMLDVTEKEKAEQMRREFTANVSHELKTPLHTISGSAELMANGMVEQEDIQKFSRRIYTEARRMVRLVEDIIRLSRLDEGADEMKWEEVDLYALAGETIQALLPEAEAAGIEMELGGTSAVVYGVRGLLRSIVFNLCDNAVKYTQRAGLNTGSPGAGALRSSMNYGVSCENTPRASENAVPGRADEPCPAGDGRRDGRVLVTVERRENCVILTVADTGIGIPKEHQERIFERFYRVDKSHSKEIGGTGLGLSIVKHAAKLHKAAIEVRSAVNAGTTMKVCFPADNGLTELGKTEPSYFTRTLQNPDNRFDVHLINLTP